MGVRDIVESVIFRDFRRSLDFDMQSQLQLNSVVFLPILHDQPTRQEISRRKEGKKKKKTTA